MITVNGEAQETQPSETLLALLERRGYRLGVIAVEYNGQVLSKDAYGTILLKDGDKLEVVSFVGGG